MHLLFKYRSGWHLPVTGVAVASSILCISTTLNKKDLQYGIFISRINALSNIQGEYYRNINGFSMDIFPKVSKIGSHFFIGLAMVALGRSGQIIRIGNGNRAETKATGREKPVTDREGAIAAGSGGNRPETGRVGSQA